MFALHALWQRNRTLAVWVEDARPAPDGGEPADPVSGPARPHPCAGPADLVGALLAGVGPGLEWLVGEAAAGALVIDLPTGLDGVPRPSPELPGEPPRGPRPGLALRPWLVPALVFDADQAAQLLGALFDPRHAALRTEVVGDGSVDVPYGASLRWLTAVHDLAWRMVGRGRVLPGIAVRDGTAYARWLPAPTETDWRLIRALAAACPPVCRAGHAEDAPRTAAVTGTALVDDLLAALVDAETRAALDGMPSLLPPGRPPRPPESAAEHWLAALTTASGRLDATGPAEAEDLRAALAAWHATESAPARPLRTCFRLVEPLGPDPADLHGGTTDDNWRVDILLQAPDEPSLLVEASRVWDAGPVLAVFERKQYQPQEALLADLDRASRTWPALAATLRESRPGSVRLDRAGALDFLRRAAPALAASGFGVLLPTWWQHPPRLGLTLTARTRTPGLVAGGGLLDQDAVVAFAWQAALGDAVLTADELRELAATTQPLVRFRGQWTEADPRAIAAAADLIARDGTGTMTAGEVVRIAVDPAATVAGLPVRRVDADAWLGELLAGADELRTRPVSLPATFTATLRPYQQRGLEWLAFMSRLGVGAVLADDMGLGKTVQTLALVSAEHAERGEPAGGVRDVGQPPSAASAAHPPPARSPSPTQPPGADAAFAPPPASAGPTLVVCPMSLVGNWVREARRFAPELRVVVHHGSVRHRDAGDLRTAVADADLVVTTYETAHRDVATLRTVAWRRVVADEAQQIKNIATRQSRALRALPAHHRVALTGTPVENRLAELHSVLDFANPGLFGDAERFKATYAIAIERNGSASALAALRRVAAPFVLRRHKTDPAIAADLPAKQEMTVLCTLTPEQAGLYRAVVADMDHRVRHTAGIERQGLILATLGKLKQICNHPAQFLHERGTPVAARSGKVERLVATLEEALAEGDRALCFTQYARFGALLQEHLAERLGTEVLFLHGGITGRSRDRLVERFQAGGPSVFVLSLKAGGTGLNLTAANQVIHVDRWWNPAVEDQATDRAYRIGQRQSVQVRKFVCAGTVEERVDAVIAGKRGLAASVVGGTRDDRTRPGERWLTDMSADALRELVALSEEAEP
ncbi:DEAD/DEAH box helicase [Yinghuangia sp. ASG 101]|uniref:DEAD/DEAH box helicase n=1 Tax=Yinghuangia sp. ASG 101 TaxID=2896848 RepID=UPI001E2F7598|nr:DEAD/DEAH box helicase [Yinghuangia sp. ASG 101]UGQ13029.1 DEAD/DEAH box helicase [Yinghuangia sp. ASG 101]